VETTFKLIAYTGSKMHLALLKLFTRIEYVLPNLIIGTLTRKSVQRAFKKGITADKIVYFLESHAHLNARLNKLLRTQERLPSLQDMDYKSYSQQKQSA
jgi:hypothetical protein